MVNKPSAITRNSEPTRRSKALQKHRTICPSSGSRPIGQVQSQESVETTTDGPQSFCSSERNGYVVKIFGERPQSVDADAFIISVNAPCILVGLGGANAISLHAPGAELS